MFGSSVVNRDKSDILAKYLRDRRYEACNYYQADSFIAECSLEWVIEALRRRLETCLNADAGICTIWYLESHSECKLLMDLIYQFGGDEAYNPKFSTNDPWD